MTRLGNFESVENSEQRNRHFNIDKNTMLPSELDRKKLERSSEKPETKEDDGDVTKIYRYGNRGTGRAHKDFEKDISDLDRGIGNLKDDYRQVANGIMNDAKDTENNGDLSRKQKIDNLKGNKEQLEKLQDLWNEEGMPLYEKRNSLKNTSIDDRDI